MFGIIRIMSKARNIKSPDHYYFDTSVIGDFTEKGEPYTRFIKDYAKYVFSRAKTFSGRYVLCNRHYTVTEDISDLKS